MKEGTVPAPATYPRRARDLHHRAREVASQRADSYTGGLALTAAFVLASIFIMAALIAF